MKEKDISPCNYCMKQYNCAHPHSCIDYIKHKKKMLVKVSEKYKKINIPPTTSRLF